MSFANGGKHDELIAELIESGRLKVVHRREELPIVLVFDLKLGRYRPATISPNHDGYPTTALKLKRGALWRTVRLRLHRVVWVAANGTADRTLEIDHVDTDRGNYRLGNLCPVTRRENEIRKHEARFWRERYEEEFGTGEPTPAEDLPF